MMVIWGGWKLKFWDNLFIIGNSNLIFESKILIMA